MAENLQNVEEQLERYKTIFDNALVGIYIIQDGKITFANQKVAELFGQNSPEEFMKNPLQSYIHPDDLKIAYENLKKRESGEVKIVHYYLRGIKKNGEARNFEVLGSAINFNGKPAVQGMVMDVTDKVRTDEELKKKIEQLELFHQTTVDRELKMVELEKEIDELLRDLGRPAKYKN